MLCGSCLEAGAGWWLECPSFHLSDFVSFSRLYTCSNGSLRSAFREVKVKAERLPHILFTRASHKPGLDSRLGEDSSILGICLRFRFRNLIYHNLQTFRGFSCIFLFAVNYQQNCFAVRVLICFFIILFLPFLVVWKLFSIYIKKIFLLITLEIFKSKH